MLGVRNTFQWGLPTLRTMISCSAAGAKGSILSVDQVSTQSGCASTIAPPGAAASSSLESSDAAVAIRWDKGVRGTPGLAPSPPPAYSSWPYAGETRSEQTG